METEAETDLFDNLNALNYEDGCFEKNKFLQSLDEGISNKDFRKLVTWLLQEIHALRKTDETIESGIENTEEFTMELSVMLKELNCPYDKFITGPINERFSGKYQHLQLLDYLIAELMTAKMLYRLKPADKSFLITKTETNTARCLDSLSKELRIGQIPKNISPKALFDKMNFKLEETLKNIKSAYISPPLLKTSLTNEQWKTLQTLQEDLEKEYNLRREVLLQRLEVTIQSFLWSQNMRKLEKDINQRYENKVKELEQYKIGGKDTDIIALLAAREDLAIMEKTSSANVRKNTSSKIQKHVIGTVPDRGGRAYEHAPPPPEMPSWQQNRAPGPFNMTGHRGGGGGRGGGGHGSNWQKPQGPRSSFQQQDNFQSGGQERYDPSSRQNWIQGSGRVQGAGWNQGTTDYNNQDSGYNRGGYNRGQGQYNRGGGGHYRGGRRR